MNPRPLLRSLLVCPLLLAPLLPGVSSAAEDAPLRTRPVLLHKPDAPEVAPPPPREEPEPARWGAPRGVRIIGEVGGGAIGTLSGGLVGGLVGGGVCLAAGWDKTEKLGCLGSIVLGSSAGLLVGYPLGVWGVGEALGGDGRLWATALGTSLGVVGGALLFSQVGASSQGGEFLAAAPFVLGAVGGIAGYEWSQRETPEAVVATRPRWQPLVSVSGRGALLGLGGRF